MAFRSGTNKPVLELRASFSPPVHRPTSISCAFSRKQPRQREVIEGMATCFSNAFTKWHVFEAVDSLLIEGLVVLLRAGRRCIRRGRLGGHSDRAWDDGSRESRRRGFRL
jgi:hypothetical protein